MRVLIIGGTGLLGSHLVPVLEAQGHEVALCDNFSGSVEYKVPKGNQLFVAGATEMSALRHPFSVFKPEIVVVSLAYTPSRGTEYNFFDDVRTVIDSANVVSALLTPQVKHVYFCSSNEVYGPPRSRKSFKETRKINQSASHHGTAKFVAERLLSFRCAELDIPLTVLRIFDLYGPRPVFSARTGVVSFLINGLLRGMPLGLVAARALRDFIHVEDAAHVIGGVVESGFAGVVNVGTGKGTTLEQIAEVLFPLVDGAPKPEVLKSVQKPFPAVADTTLLDSLLLGEWQPKHDVLTALPSLVEFQRAEQEFRADYAAVNKAMRGGG